MARLTNVLLLLREGTVPRAAKFFQEGLGMHVNMANENYAEVMAGSTVIALKASANIASSTTGYSPMLQLEIDDMDSTIVKALSTGGTLDGPIKYPAHGKVACIRAPGGQMIGLFEPNMELLAMRQAHSSGPK